MMGRDPLAHFLSSFPLLLHSVVHHLAQFTSQAPAGDVFASVDSPLSQKRVCLTPFPFFPVAVSRLSPRPFALHPSILLARAVPTRLSSNLRELGGSSFKPFLLRALCCCCCVCHGITCALMRLSLNSLPLFNVHPCSRLSFLASLPRFYSSLLRTLHSTCSSTSTPSRASFSDALPPLYPD